MTTQEWNELAEGYKQKQHEAEQEGDKMAAEFYSNKKRSCWAMLPYATQSEPPEDENKSS